MSFIEGNIKVETEDGKIKDFSCPVESDEGDVAVDYKPIKKWKKTISHFLRHLPRATKSIDGDIPSGSQENVQTQEEISIDQKWQSLGKIFRRRSMIDDRQAHEYRNQYGETSMQNKRTTGLKKVFSNYFSKGSNPKPAKSPE